jgi:hypothetical protein
MQQISDLKMKSPLQTEAAKTLYETILTIRPHLRNGGTHKAEWVHFSEAALDLPNTMRMVLQKHPAELAQFEKDIASAAHYESRVLNNTITRVQNLLEQAFKIPDEVSVEGLIGPQRLSSRSAHYFRMNPWLLEFIQHMRDTTETPHEAFEKTRSIFPDLLSPLPETEYTKCTAVLLGIRRFVERAENHPDKFPFFNAVIR